MFFAFSTGSESGSALRERLYRESELFLSVIPAFKHGSLLGRGVAIAALRRKRLNIISACDIFIVCTGGFYADRAATGA